MQRFCLLVVHRKIQCEAHEIVEWQRDNLEVVARNMWCTGALCYHAVQYTFLKLLSAVLDIPSLSIEPPQKTSFAVNFSPGDRERSGLQELEVSGVGLR